MKVFLLPLLLLVSSCTVFGPGPFEFSVSVTEITNVAEGVRVTFTVDSDGEDIALVGAGYGLRPDFDLRENQEFARQSEPGSFEVVFTDARRGTIYVQAFAAFDAFYELSDPIPFEVR